MKRERADRETTQESILNLPSICLPGWNIAGETFQTEVSSPFLSLSLFHLLESTNCTTPDIFYDILHSLPKEAERDDSDSFFFSFLTRPKN